MERCNICNKDLSTLPKEGCEQCGLEYDPMTPESTAPLDFNQEVQTEYLPSEELGVTDLPPEEGLWEEV